VPLFLLTQQREDGKTGFVVCRGDETMLMERVIKLITDCDPCQRMGDAVKLRLNGSSDWSDSSLKP
jgi:hypothetical protein